MDLRGTSDVLVQVDTLFKKLESLPHEIKQAAFSKIYEKLPSQLPKPSSESEAVVNETQKKKKRPGRKPKNGTSRNNAVFRFYGSESHDSEYMVQNVFTSRGRKAKRICCAQINRNHTSSDEERFEKPKSPIGSRQSDKFLDELKGQVEWNSKELEREQSKSQTTQDNSDDDLAMEKSSIETESREAKSEKSFDSTVEDSDLIIDSEASSADNSSVEVKKPTPKQIVSCDQCNFHTSNKTLLKSHLRKHTGARPYVCKECGKSFPQSSGLAVHLKRHRGQRDFPCDYACDYRAYTKVDKVRHMTIHTGERNHICQYCGKSFAKDSTLREHVKCVHERPNKHVCPKCGFTTFRANNLRVHISMRHRGEYNNHVCPVCGAKVKQRTAFLDHMRSHTGERPYSCHQCDSTFACLARLTVHRKAVHEPRQFTCKVCFKPFQTKHHLLRHLVIHTKEKPFACPFCLYTCNTQGNVTKHVKTVHNKPEFSYRKYKADQQVDPDANSLKSEWIEKGQKLTEEYLKELSRKLGRDVTVSELQEREAEKLKQLHEEQELGKLKRMNRIRKHEHSYHSSRITSVNDTRLEEEAVDDPTTLLLNVAQQIPSESVSVKLNIDKAASTEIPLESQNFSGLNVDSIRNVSQTIFIHNSVGLQESGVQEFQAVLSQSEGNENADHGFVSSNNIQFCVPGDFLGEEQSSLHVIYHDAGDEDKERTREYNAVENEEYIQNIVAVKGSNQDNPTVVVIINTESTEV